MSVAANAFSGFVRHSSDARLERLLGAHAVQRAFARRLAARYRPDAVEDFAGELQLDLRRRDGRVDSWTVRVGRGTATALEGPAGAPALRVVATVPDLARMAARELPIDRAVLEGRLDLHGDWGVAARLGQMFGAAA